MAMTEGILGQLSMQYFVEECEKHLAHVFECKRANIVLVDRFNEKFFKTVIDQQGYSKKIIYEIDASLAGAAAISLHPIFTDNVKEESRYS